MSPLEDRLRGVLYGLAAGDRIGGPIAMALCLSESLIIQRAFDANDILVRYLAWWTQAGFDTGPVASQVFARVSRGIPYQEATFAVHVALDEQTAGCNPAHRIAPLAMAAFVPSSMLAASAHQEAALTHWDVIAGDVAATVAQLCRKLITGEDWSRAVQQSLPSSDVFGTQHDPGQVISRPGYAPNVLRTAIHFVNKHSNFEAALKDAIDFAGPANYCPVLVGAFAGARWGRSAIFDELLNHCHPISKQLAQLITAFVDTWQNQQSAKAIREDVVE